MATWPATVVFRLAFFYWALLLCRSVRPPRQSLCATTPVVLCDYPLSLCATRYGVIHRGCQHVGVGLLTVLVGPVDHHHPARFGERLDVTHHGRAVHPGVLGDALIRRPRVARGVRSQADRPRHRARGTGQVGVPHATHPRVRLHSSSPGLHSGHSHGGGSFGGLTLGIVQPIYFSFTSGGHNTSGVVVLGRRGSTSRQRQGESFLGRPGVARRGSGWRGVACRAWPRPSEARRGWLVVGNWEGTQAGTDQGGHVDQARRRPGKASRLARRGRGRGKARQVGSGEARRGSAGLVGKARASRGQSRHVGVARHVERGRARQVGSGGPGSDCRIGVDRAWRGPAGRSGAARHGVATSD